MSETTLEIAPVARKTAGSEVFSLLADALCQHCGHHPFALPEARAIGRTPVPGIIEDDEAWLWHVVDDGEQTRDAAPNAPALAEIAAARRILAGAMTAHRRVDVQVRALEIALGRPSTWLRPRHRVALATALRRGRVAQFAAVSTRETAARVCATMDRKAAQRRSYLAIHHALLESAANARRELDRRIDAQINAYSKALDPPAWFRFGLGYPPASGSYTEWLARARKAIAYRRRHGIDHPLEPTGGMPFD